MVGLLDGSSVKAPNRVYAVTLDPKHATKTVKQGPAAVGVFPDYFPGSFTVFAADHT